MGKYFAYKFDRRYYPRKGLLLPRKLYKSLIERNGSPPFTLYAFMQAYRWPHVELYDDYCRTRDISDFFEGWEPEIVKVDCSRRVILPKSFAAGITSLEKKVVVVGNWNCIDIFRPEVWKAFDDYAEGKMSASSN